jgi:uncharacterized protein involved in outer membrane biogenesis
MRRVLIIAAAVGLLLVLAGAGALYYMLSGDGIRSALEQQASSWLGVPVRIGSARAQFVPRIGVSLADVRVGEPSRLTLASVVLSTDLRALLAGRIEAAEVTVADSRLEMPLPFALPAAGEETVAAAGDGAPGFELVSVRSIALRNVVLVSRGREVTISAASSFVGNELRVTSLTAHSGRTELDGEGVVQLQPRLDARLRIGATRLDVDELVALADAFAPEASAAPQRASTRAPARIAARVSAETATAGALTVRQFATELELDGDRLSLSPLTFQLFGGRYQGTLRATLGTSLTATLQSRVTDLDVAELAAFGGVPDTVTGRLTGAATFTGSGADFTAILRGARGNGTVEIVDGTIARLGLMRTVVLFFGRPAPDTASGSDAFTRLDARFTLASQVVRGDALALQSRDADIVGTGTLNVSSTALDAHVDLSLSEELSSQAGTDLRRYTREGNRIVLPANVGGTLSAPRLTIDAAAAVQRGLRNEVERRLKGLLDRF